MEGQLPSSSIIQEAFLDSSAGECSLRGLQEHPIYHANISFYESGFKCLMEWSQAAFAPVTSLMCACNVQGSPMPPPIAAFPSLVEI